MIWIISAMLVYHDVPQPVITDYTIKSIDTLFKKHREKEGKKLKTFAFFCENRYVQLDEV